jgi:SAM-dependent methyltransferase
MKWQVQGQPKSGLLERLSDGICRRAFSAPEATAYEATIAPALAAALVPEICPFLVGSRVLDVGCGGGRIAHGLIHAGFAVVGLDPSPSQVRRFGHRVGRCGGAVEALAAAMPFLAGSFESVYSSCAWKHWPVPAQGTAECIRITKAGGAVVVIEIDGSATTEEFWSFARTSRIPFGLHKAYLRFAMRTVVGVAPDAEELAASFEVLPVSRLKVGRIPGTPFLRATARLT